MTSYSSNCTYATLFFLMLSLCNATPNFYIITEARPFPDPTPPPNITDPKQSMSWCSSVASEFWASYYPTMASSMTSSWASAQSEINKFVATATHSIPPQMTDMDTVAIYTESAMSWFTALPEDVQRAKIQEGEAMYVIWRAYIRGLTERRSNVSHTSTAIPSITTDWSSAASTTPSDTPVAMPTTNLDAVGDVTSSSTARLGTVIITRTLDASTETHPTTQPSPTVQSALAGKDTTGIAAGVLAGVAVVVAFL
ncbi:hypothetical protein P153DRAFT_400930 [Dothidotthia symphoricarpi CBS 119687]|uniref:Uncharacterized protein n=1 Tax=Dothidotthia symphoricarpi CBS 119687 TaxID=1392245 RepID=A0A6A5ZZ63_9PLEO|nr:uncharacterized protein P153DRAFT_400930 [Dothidotthia symphoricarpi CBS 119687]KAF2124859.1 hypothetical protein P153DRAFT_400930 [Dothidotthia symphoricarpi CBS 119687]